MRTFSQRTNGIAIAVQSPRNYRVARFHMKRLALSVSSDLQLAQSSINIDCLAMVCVTRLRVTMSVVNEVDPYLGS